MHRSRLRSVCYAVATGMLLGCGSVLGIFLLATPGYANEATGGTAGMLALMMPGTIFLGLLFTLPSACALVFTMAGIQRSGIDVLAPWRWALGGFLASLPVAWLFGFMLRESLFDLPSAHMILLGFGVLSGLAARWGYREVADDNFERNAATTVS
ncbi:hypothetical protein [Aurantiacibacter luteus]|uniref:Lipoprotein n=1 Tax=Aurantiacibacter luteus TaxID=1581420 RepID=A0A0G9N2E8_9SPHN|nr:hypothetical protein [Aurantiacibacter luteus]KLE35703.1 hypothetical protein AAW00_04730 [Aurantiacibacter luteus]